VERGRGCPEERTRGKAARGLAFLSHSAKDKHVHSATCFSDLAKEGGIDPLTDEHQLLVGDSNSH